MVDLQDMAQSLAVEHILRGSNDQFMETLDNTQRLHLQVWYEPGTDLWYVT